VDLVFIPGDQVLQRRKGYFNEVFTEASDEWKTVDIPPQASTM
jgi:hypothetical protein